METALDEATAECCKCTPISPYISLYLPMQVYAYISLYLPISPYISLYLPISPHISLYLDEATAECCKCTLLPSSLTVTPNPMSHLNLHP